MKKMLFRLFLVMVLLTSCVGANDSLKNENVEEEVVSGGLTKDIHILVTSDVHCGIDQNFCLDGLYDIRKKLEEEGNYTILVDDGDFIQGEPIGSLTKGSALINLMNELEYDVAIPGNHEFDYGMDVFLDLTKKANFPYVSSNFNKNGELVFSPYVIKEFDGVKVAFVGVTTPFTITSSTPKYFQDEEGNFVYGFFQDAKGETLYKKVQEAVDSARTEGVDYVFLMSHLGNEAECMPYTYAEVILNTEGIDVVLDGHSHDTDQVTMKNKIGKDVLRTAVGTKMSCIGDIVITKDGKIENKFMTYEGEDTYSKVNNLNNKLTVAINNETSSINKMLDEVIAKTDYQLAIYDPNAVDENGKNIRIVRRTETNLGDLITDAYRELGNTDIAITNGGGIRTNIEIGDIKRNDILKVAPFNNMLCTVEVTGRQILNALEWGARAVPGESGGFLQCSGMSYEIHTYIDSTAEADENNMFTRVSGEYRVKNVKVNGEDLDLDKKYTLSGLNYILLNNGDGYTAFKGARVLSDNFMVDHEAIMEYIEKNLNGVISDKYKNPYGEGRIIAVDK